MALDIDTSSLDRTSRMKLNVNSETGQITGASEIYADAIQQIYEAAKAPATIKEKKLTLINEKVAALSSFQTDVTALQTASSVLFDTNAQGEGVFSQLVANCTSTSTTPIANVLDANISDQANLQEFTVQVNQVANYDFSAATTGVSSPSTALGWSGTITLNGQTITLTTSMTLEDINTLINSYTGTTNVNSTILMQATGNYLLCFEATDLASPMTITNSTTAPAGAIPAQTTNSVASLSANFIFNGISMTRTTNTITDITQGLTLQLISADPGVITVRTSPDQAAVTQAIQNWVNALNKVLSDIAAQQSYDYNTQAPSKDALLFGSDIIQTVNTTVDNIMAWVVEGVSSTDYNILEQIGITLNYDMSPPQYVIDSTTLSDALLSNFKGVEKLFDYEDVLSNSNFLVTSHPASISQDIIASAGVPLTTTITVNKNTSGVISSVDLTINGGVYAGDTFTIPSSDIIIMGNDIAFLGSDAVSTSTTQLPYSGFSFNYTGISNIAAGSSDSTTLTMTQGYADQFVGNITNLLAPDTGTAVGAFVAQQEDFTNKIDTLQTAIQKINEKADKERKKYEAQFGRLEAAREQLVPLQNIANAFTAALSKG